MSFLSLMFDEMGARRRRLRGAFGNMGQGVAEFLVLSGLMIGSLGLLIYPWMPRAVPWGFAMPFVFVGGFAVLEARRQQGLARYQASLPLVNDRLDEQEWERKLAAMRREDPDLGAGYIAEAQKMFQAGAEDRRRARINNAAEVFGARYDWSVFLWAYGCALAGVAAFVIGYTAPPEWIPPHGTINSCVGPTC